MAGILGALELFKRAEAHALEEARQSVGPQPGIRMSPLSPWATRGNLAKVAFEGSTFDGRPAGPPSRTTAMQCAPIKKGRAILHAVLTSAPLVAIRNVDGVDTPLTGKDAPTWLYRSDTGIAPEQRMAEMVDDHLFNEATLLAVRRGTAPADQQRGTILDAVHVPYSWWEVDEDGYLLVDDQPVDPDAYLWIPGPSMGLLAEAADEIHHWRATSQNIARRLGVPLPGIILEDEDTGDVDDDEVEKMVRKVAEARRSPDGGVMYVPAGMKATPVPINDDGQLYTEFRNALRIDFANHMNLPVALLDGSPATASLTYSTSEGKRSELDDFGLDYWTTPLTAGLSLDAVVPRGTRIRFDFTSRYAPTNAPTGALTQD